MKMIWHTEKSVTLIGILITLTITPEQFKRSLKGLIHVYMRYVKRTASNMDNMYKLGFIVN